MVHGGGMWLLWLLGSVRAGCYSRAPGLADAAVESSERLAALLVRVSPCKAWWTFWSPPERFWARLGGRKMQAWAASVESGGGARRQPCEKDRREGDDGRAEQSRAQLAQARRIEFASGRRAKGEASWQWFKAPTRALRLRAREGVGSASGFALGARGWQRKTRRRKTESRIVGQVRSGRQERQKSQGNVDVGHRQSR
ncbi:hypothetical protein V8C34DRAFT_256016 [Trichoderma compactum]